MPPVLFGSPGRMGAFRFKRRFSWPRTCDTCTWSDLRTTTRPPGATLSQPASDAVVEVLRPMLDRQSLGLGAEGASGLNGAGPQLEVGAVAFVEAAMEVGIITH